MPHHRLYVTVTHNLSTGEDLDIFFPLQIPKRRLIAFIFWKLGQANEEGSPTSSNSVVGGLAV